MAVSASILTRRSFVAAAGAAGAFPAQLIAQARGGLIAGTYAREGGAGVVPLLPGGNGWAAGAAHAAIRNASFGVQARGIRYLVDEQERGALGVYDRDLRRLGSFSTLGADPCHVALSDDGRLLAVANYSSGDVALWRLNPKTGLPIGDAQLIRHRGSGPNRGRQAGPHAHWVGFAASGRSLHAVDLGADAIFAHAVDPRGGAIGTSLAYRAAAGSGPRHLARHPHLPVAYLVAELANTVTTLAANADGTFTARNVVSTLPEAFAGTSAAAHIALNRAGSRLYISNRGHDSIAVFAVDARGGLAPIQHVGCGGHWPRLFLLREERAELLVANERSGNIARLPLRADGRLGPATRGVAVPGVAFLG